MKHIGIIGTRTFNDYEVFTNNVEQLLPSDKKDVVIVSGGAIGTDSLAARYSIENNLKLIEFKPDYATYPGHIAPLMRNKDIVANSDFLIAFWDGKSKGTLYTIAMAAQMKKTIYVIGV